MKVSLKSKTVKKAFFIFCVSLAGLLISVGWLSKFTLAQAQNGNVDDFEFASFDADYYLTRGSDRTSILTVNEVLVAKFPDFDQNHGILRAIPDRYQNHTVSLKILSVTDQNDRAHNYTTYKSNDNLVLKIGDPDKYVHGQQTYKISYQMRSVINFQPGSNEFYWDINGDQWPQAFGQVAARIHIPGELAAALLPQQKCYSGFFGGTASDCTVTSQTGDGETLVTIAANSALRPRQTLTAVLAFDQDTFVIGPEVVREQLQRKIKITLGAMVIILPPLIAAVVMYGRWRRFGDDPKGRGVIIPEYTPPKGFSVLTGSFMLEQKISQRAFSAAIVELAVSRYLNIYETKQKKALRRDETDYELELIRDPAGVSPEMGRVIASLFGSGKVGVRVKLSELQSQRGGVYEAMRATENLVSQNLTDGGYFKKDPKKVKAGYMSWAAAVFFASMAGLFIWPVTVLAIGLAAAAAVMLGFAFVMPARTEPGVWVHDDLLGLKDYIKMAEANRLKYLQSPQGAERVAAPEEFNPESQAQKIKLFEKLLPYAILFGLEKDWAKQFQNLYKQPPQWYSGDWAVFNAGYLASSLNGFSTSVNQVFAPPASSSGSGFGGGGGSGGGGGGGGGW